MYLYTVLPKVTMVLTNENEVTSIPRKRKTSTDNPEAENPAKVSKPPETFQHWTNGSTVVEDIQVANEITSLIIGKNGKGWTDYWERR